MPGFLLPVVGLALSGVVEKLLAGGIVHLRPLGDFSQGAEAAQTNVLFIQATIADTGGSDTVGVCVHYQTKISSEFAPVCQFLAFKQWQCQVF